MQIHTLTLLVSLQTLTNLINTNHTFKINMEVFVMNVVTGRNVSGRRIHFYLQYILLKESNNTQRAIPQKHKT